MTNTNSTLRNAIINTGLNGGRCATLAEITGYLRRAGTSAHRNAVRAELEAMLAEGLVECERHGAVHAVCWNLVVR